MAGTTPCSNSASNGCSDLSGIQTSTTSQRPASARLARLVWVLVLLLTGSGVFAADDPEPILSLGDPYLCDGLVCFDLELNGLTNQETAEALHTGLPATVIVQWGIWRRRAAWPDEKLVSGSTFYRVFYDVLEQRYDLFDSSGRPLAGSEDLAAIEQALSRRRGLATVRAMRLEPETSYVMEVLVRLEPLDDQEISNLESWAHGGRDETFLSSVSNSTLGWLKNLVGPRIRSAWARSRTFTVEALEKANEPD